MAESLRADLPNPPVVLVLVVNEGRHEGCGDYLHLSGGTGVAGSDGTDAGMHTIGDGVPEYGVVSVVAQCRRPPIAGRW